MRNSARVHNAPPLARPSRCHRSASGRCVAIGLAAFLGLAMAAACGDTSSLDGTPLLTLEQCSEQGGSPLFDPDDGRPIEDSCPEGLRFLGEFTEPFFGEDGGLCCINAGSSNAGSGDERPTERSEPSRL
jgi:hypothetical protein